MNLFLIISVIILLLFIPIPLKFTTYYNTKDYYIKLYTLTIFSKKKLQKKRDKKENFKEQTPCNKTKSLFSKYSLKNINYRALIEKLNHIKFKPLLRINFNLDYSLNDAAKTGIFYGVLCQIPPLIYVFINVPFKTIKFDFNIDPIFEDRFLLEFETSSIFFFSIANIIYVSFILLKFIIKAREVTP